MTNLLLRSVFAGLIALTIGACENDITQHDPHQSHPSTVERKVARMDMGPLYAGKPSPGDSDRIDEFLAAYHGQGEKPLEVTVPGKSTEDPVAREHALQIANALMQRGVPSEEINLYVAETQTEGTASMAFPIYVVTPEACGYWDKPIDSDYENGITANFGCATQHNIDAMAANPRDLAYPQEASGRMGARSFYVIDNFQKGKALPSANDLGQDFNFRIGPI